MLNTKNIIIQKSKSNKSHDTLSKFQERKLMELQSSLDGMNRSIERLETEIRDSTEENKNLKKMLTSLREQIQVQQDSLKAAASDNNQQVKW